MVTKATSLLLNLRVGVYPLESKTLSKPTHFPIKVVIIFYNATTKHILEIPLLLLYKKAAYNAAFL